MLYNRKFSLPRLACARLIRKVSDASTSILQHHMPLQRWNTKISAMYLTTQRVPEQQLLFLTSCSLVTSVVNEVWLLQTKDLIVTQNDLEAILKPWQSKLCFIVFFFPSLAVRTHRSILFSMRILQWNFHLLQTATKRPQACPVTSSLEGNALINSYPWVIFDNGQYYASSY